MQSPMLQVFPVSFLRCHQESKFLNVIFHQLAVKFLEFNQYHLCPFQGAISHFVDRSAAHLVP